VSGVSKFAFGHRRSARTAGMAEARRTYGLRRRQRRRPSGSRARRQRQVFPAAEGRRAAPRTRRTRPCRYAQSCVLACGDHFIPQSRASANRAGFSVWFRRDVVMPGSVPEAYNSSTGSASKNPGVLRRKSFRCTRAHHPENGDLRLFYR